MRRGGRIFLLLGVIIAAAAAVLFLVFIGGGTPGGTAQPIDTIPPTATPVPPKQVVVARADIPNNTVLTDTETFLQFGTVPETEYNAAPDTYFTSFSELTSKITVRDISANEVMRDDVVVDAGLSLQIPQADTPDATRPKALSIEVDNLSGVGDQVRQGDFVDLVMTFQIERVILRPSLTTDPTTGLPTVTVIEVPTIFRTTKTLVQNVQVLRILRPPPPPSEEDGAAPTAVGAPPAAPAEGTAQPATGTQGGSEFITTGTWTLLLAVDNQEAELINFARLQEPDSPITLVLRGRGDTVVEETSGATLELLVSQFGLPLPEPIPLGAIPVEQLTPVPTRTPTPTVP